jgi:NADH:ubiquinone oxidoreductase subunit F (NADH-binding)
VLVLTFVERNRFDRIIEGKEEIPRIKPPFPAVSGLCKPTVVMLKQLHQCHGLYNLVMIMQN